MSLYGALFSGVSGLASQASAMGAISDNVTNVNTVGYKGTQVKFATLITKQVSLTKYSPGGVQSKPRSAIDVQGLLSATNSSTDIALSGQGFFVVNQVADPATAGTGMFAFSRAGSFKADKDGYLQNSAGFYLQGWPLVRSDNTAAAQPSEVTIEGLTYMKAYTNPDGTTHYCNENIISDTEVKGLNITTIGGTATATAQVQIGANLPAGDAVGNKHDTSVLTYDSLGLTHNVDFTWSKKAANQWDITAMPPSGASNLALYNSAGQVYRATGRLDFTAVPAAGQTIGIGGTTYTFVDGVPASANQISRTLPSTADTSSIASRLQTALNLSANGALGSTTGWTTAAGDAITVGGTVINIASMNIDQVVAAVNAQTTTTNVVAVNVAGKLGLYNKSGAAVAIANSAGTPLATMGHVAGNLSAGLDAGQRFSVNGATLEVRQTNSGAAIAFDITPGATWTTQASVNKGAATEGEFTVAAHGAIATSPAIQFDGSGVPTAINVDKMEVQWANGAIDMENGVTVAGSVVDARVKLFFGDINQSNGMTQLAGSYQVTKITQDGAKFGNFSGLSIGSDGVVTALFDNGVRRPMFQIPVATFTNPNGLEGLTGNSWIETDVSGQYTLRTAGEAGAGEVSAAALEASTVDLGEEFTTMITTQRAYSAAAKIITTADEMLDELVRIKR
jgi:flagellar hook protein FlgE